MNRADEQRVLILAPTGRDGPLTQAMLSANGITAGLCANIDEVCEGARSGAGAVIVAEEALTPAARRQLFGFLESQPPWADLPLIVFARSRETGAELLSSFATKSNASILERPISVTILVSAVRSALRARRRQYETRDLLQRLEEADRHKDLFLATLSHELRTPLTSMVGWVRLLKMDALDEDTSRHALDVIERSVDTQTRLIQDILAVSRIITGKFEMEFELVDLRACVEAAIEVVSPTATAKNIRLEQFLDPDSAYVMGDAVRLQQVVWNLLNNSLKFTPKGGRIEIYLRRLKNTVRISVCDSGEGIHPDFLPYVFDRFRQADSSYTRAAGGLGLGLAIVRHLVEMHGGRVEAESEGRNCGSSFSFAVPLAPDTAALHAGPQAESESSSPVEVVRPLEGVRVLVVEDDPDAREMLSTVLQGFGANVTVASSASEAVEKFRQVRPHVLASDLGMPDEDGFEMLRRIRNLESPGSQTPAIALSGYATIHDQKNALAAGFQRHVPKPVEPEELVRIIGELMKH